MYGMEERIVNKAKQLCRERDVTPIFVRERGSRMIGVSHEDSDWDAFILFRQEPMDYVKLGGYKDTISKKYDGGDIDFHGWNIQKFAKLLKDSNPNAVEILMGDTGYINRVRWDIFEELREDVKENFNHMSLYHHYLSLAESNYEKYISSGNDCTYNRQFYVMRATMMAKHIRKEGTFPNVDVNEFMEQTNSMTNKESGLLTMLTDRKSNGELGEANNHVGTILENEKKVEMEPTDERIKQPSTDIINELIEWRFGYE
jgi:predicted nucleotidyltransferase